MAFMDDMRDKHTDMSKIRDRYNELRAKEMRGELDDTDREELRALRAKMQKISGE